MNEITTIGIDLAKSVFTVHAVDATGRTVLRKTVRRERLMERVAGLPPSLIGMEACGGAHDWARRLQAHGHRLRQGFIEQRTATINRIRGLLAESEADQRIGTARATSHGGPSA